LEDTKVVIRICKSKDRQHNGKKTSKNITLKKVTRNEICFQNYIKFIKDPKQTKILILQFAKSIAVGHSSEKTKID
jgi:hypothetical protein